MNTTGNEKVKLIGILLDLKKMANYTN
jgi:hypothetical protein